MTTNERLEAKIRNNASKDEHDGQDANAKRDDQIEQDLRAQICSLESEKTNLEEEKLALQKAIETLT